MDEIETLITEVRENGSEFWVAGPQPEAAVVDLERAVGVPMPPRLV